jgi:hypothetical protein
VNNPNGLGRNPRRRRGQAGPDGEWTACQWLQSSGLQPEPYPSFGALAARAREFFEESSGGNGRPVHPEGAGDLLAQGRRQALAGEADGALASLHAAHAKGSALAAYLAGLLTFFTEPDPSAESYARNNVQALDDARRLIAAGDNDTAWEAIRRHSRCGRRTRPTGSPR